MLWLWTVYLGYKNMTIEGYKDVVFNGLIDFAFCLSPSKELWTKHTTPFLEPKYTKITPVRDRAIQHVRLILSLLLLAFLR